MARPARSAPSSARSRPRPRGESTTDRRARATDLVNELSTAIVNRLSPAQLAAVIRPHPTFGEAVTEAVEDLEGLAIHIAKKRR